jgi:hypothetical protein
MVSAPFAHFIGSVKMAYLFTLFYLKVFSFYGKIKAKG